MSLQPMTDPTMQQQDPVDLPSRLAMINQHSPYLDPTAQVALASSATTPNELSSIVDGIKTAVQSTYDGLTRFMSDPVLQQQPTASAALTRYVNSSIGPSPLAEPDLSHVQQQLQKQGFGTDLAATGAWDASWNAVYNQAAQKHAQDQINGNKPGSVTVGHALHSFLNYLTPVGAVNALVGFAKSIPGDLRDMAADTIGATGGLVSFFDNEVTHNPLDLARNAGMARAQARNVTLGVEHALGSSITGQQLIHDTTGLHAFGRAVNDIGTALLITGIGSAVGDSTKLISGAVKGTTGDGSLFTSTEQAMRGPGLIARNVLGGLTKEDLAKVAADGSRDELDRRVLFSKSFQNIPGLGRAAPLLGRLSDADGYWYAARSALDKPYDFGIVRAAGQTMGQVQLNALKVGGVSKLESALNGDQTSGTLSSSIAGTHVLDGLDDGIKNHLGVTAFGHHVGVSMNDLLFLLHAPTEGAAALTSQFGDSVQKMNDRVTHLLSQTKAIGQWEQATDTSYADLVEMAGGQQRANDYLIGKVLKHAAAFGADEQLRTSPLAADTLSADYLREKVALEGQIYNDPEKLVDAATRMVGNPQSSFADAVKKELIQANRRGTDGLRNDVNSYLNSAEALKAGILPNAKHILSLPLTKEQQETQAFLAATDLSGTTTTQVRSSLLPTGSIGQARFVAARDAQGNVLYDQQGHVLEARDPETGFSPSTLTAQQARLDKKFFQSQIDALPAGNAQAADDLSRMMRAYLFHNFGVDATKLRAWDGSPEGLLPIFDKQTDHLAGEIHIDPHAPTDVQDQMRRAMNAMKIEGYRPVAGTDIGHAFRHDLPQMDVLGAPLTRQRKIASALGLNTQHYSSLSLGIQQRLQMVKEIQSEIDAGRITMPPNTSVNTILSVLQQSLKEGRELPWSDNLMFAAARPFQKGQINRLMEAENLTQAEAKARLESEIAHAGGLKDLRPGEVRSILTQPSENILPAGLRSDSPLATEYTDNWFTEQDANRIYQAMQRAYSKRPAYMVGAAALENRARYLPFKAASKIGVDASGSNRAMFMLNLPNNLALLRDKYRFTLSPYFSLRRIAKTNIKMGVEGVNPTLNPVKHLIDSGQWNSAHDILDRVMGGADSAYTYLDDADRYLHGQDVVGLYNSRHYAAYLANELAAQGKTDPEIAQTVRKVMGYGTRQAEGRTALEQTTNAIFFPFSFEKTVIRNIGGYLLDRPSQALVLSNALDAYRNFNNHHLDGNNPLAASWYEQHVPLLQEALRLNAFEHGISPGQFGGINAPLLNIFMPQSYTANADLTAHLKKLMPAVNDLSRIIKEGNQQQRIVRTSVFNGVAMANDKLRGIQRGPFEVRPSNKTDDAQRQEAFDLRNKLVDALKPVLDYNAGTSDDNAKYHWPTVGPQADHIPAEMRGQAINKESIGLLVQHAYPVYNPAAGAGYAIQKQIDVNKFLSRAAGTPNYAVYKDFVEKARTAVGHLNKDEYTADQAAQVTQVFRERAIELASKDPAFYKIYRKAFSYAFGPLEVQS